MRNGTWEATRYPGIYRMPSPRTTSGYRYKVRYRDAGGASRSKQFVTQDEAKEFNSGLGQAKATGTLADLAKGNLTVRELAGRVAAAKKLSASRRSYFITAMNKIGPTADKRVRDVTEAHIDSILNAETKAPSQDKLRQFLASLFNFAQAKKWIVVSPMPVQIIDNTRAGRTEKRPSQERPKKYLTDEQFDQLLAATPDQWKAAVILGGRMGLRPGEVFGLTVGHFTPATEVPARSSAKLVVNTSINEERLTKTGLSRTLPLPPLVAEVLVAHIDAHTDGRSDSPLFTNERGQSITTKNDLDAWRRRHWSKIATAAELADGYTPNDLRHSAASYAIRHGANVYAVKEMLGHAKASMTLDTYGELWDETLEELMVALDTAMRQTA